MRVSIEHSELTKGLFSKKTYYQVSVTVEFSEEEKAIINQSDLTETVVLERDVPADRDPSSFEGIEDWCYLTIGDLVDAQTETYVLATPLEAKQYEKHLTEALQNLKLYIQENAGVDNKSKTFEL